LLQDFFGQLALDRGQLTVFLVLHALLLRKEHRNGKSFATGLQTAKPLDLIAQSLSTKNREFGKKRKKPAW